MTTISNPQSVIAGLTERIRRTPVANIDSDGRISVGSRVMFTFTHDDHSSTTAEGTVLALTRSGRSTFAAIETDHGTTVIRHACDVQAATDWRERLDPVVVNGYGDGSGPLPILTHPDEGAHVEVSWMLGSVLLVGIYTTERKGTVYRWDNGLEQPPTVIDWDLDGPECGCES